LWSFLSTSQLSPAPPLAPITGQTKTASLPLQSFSTSPGILRFRIPFLSSRNGPRLRIAGDHIRKYSATCWSASVRSVATPEAAPALLRKNNRDRIQFLQLFWRVTRKHVKGNTTPAAVNTLNTSLIGIAGTSCVCNYFP